MSLLIFAVWTVLLGGQFIKHLNAIEYGWAVAEDDSPQSNAPIKCPDPLPRTCKEVKSVGNRAYVTLLDGLEVLCDTKSDGGGWIIFQRRLSSDVSFFRDWTDYKDGFGNIRGNFWLGNDNIHRLTSGRRYELRVDFTFNGKSYFAKYSKFRIFGEAEKYKLEVGGYSGNAGDDLSHHNGMAFSTRDRDNDLVDKENCALTRMSGWWYRACSHCHLNGQWGGTLFGRGMTWESITGPQNSVKSSEMKIRALD